MIGRTGHCWAQPGCRWTVSCVPGPSGPWDPRMHHTRPLPSKSQDQEQLGCPWETNNYRAVPCPLRTSHLILRPHPLHPVLLKRKLSPEPPRFPCAEEEAGSGRARGLPQGQTLSSVPPHPPRPVNQSLVILTGFPRVSPLGHTSLVIIVDA